MKLSDALRSTGMLLGLLVTFAAATLPTAAAAESLSAMTQPAGLHVHMQSELDPLVINQMHSWIIRVEDAQGNPVSDADIRVDGGMPEHNHGLATRPQITANLGEGDYRLEGVRFHMNGEWELRLQIDHAGVTYQTALTLTL
ncbi:hypothetical protein PHACT_10600 [Pseudohongiella acticola]|jgi:YtkA-like|uniref:YtkA-like domain-containing protein n=1 Tax=Pseudohongiella acticola TaxID=1524254 RepID=A0A1E8CM31_9GAMM|nr:FixH family protein [Pseudohongiella acticola]OFE13531.1 hypothetical protein PHACT_10600 [Pseudohongiella acticola]